MSNYTQKVTSYLRKQEDQEFGFLDWRALADINAHFEGLLTALKSSGKKQDLLDFCVEIIVQVNGYLLRTDDSNGNLQDTIAFAFNALYELIENDDLTSPQKNYLFETLLICLDDDHIYDFDFGTNIWELLSVIVQSQQQYDYFKQKMNALLNKTKDNRSIDYTKEKIINNCYQALNSLGHTAESVQLLQDNIHFNDIRIIVVEQAIESKNYVNAQKLINDGIQIAREKGHSGTVSTWEDQLLKIAILENNNKDIIHKAKHNLLDHHFDINNYKLYKQYSPTSNWSKLRNDIINDLKNKKRGLSAIDLMTIYSLENLIPELFSTIADYGVDFYNIDDYFDVLESHDKDRLIILYIERVKMFLANRTGRKYYKVAVRYIRKLKNMGADEKVTDLVAELRKVHIRRPALLQEFIGL